MFLGVTWRRDLSVPRRMVPGMCNDSITCSVFERIIDYASNK